MHTGMNISEKNITTRNTDCAARTCTRVYTEGDREGPTDNGAEMGISVWAALVARLTEAGVAVDTLVKRV